MQTKAWAASHNISVADTAPPILNYEGTYKRTAEDVAVRAVILHCVAAVGFGLDPSPIIDWLKAQSLWISVSPKEQAFLCADTRSDEACNDARWRTEAQWTLLWSIQYVDALGLPTQCCNTAKLVDDIMPALDEPLDSFITQAALRPPSEFFAEQDRVYNLHCYARQAYRQKKFPEDLIYDVLFQRHYAFEWLDGDDWDDVRTDT